MSRHGGVSSLPPCSITTATAQSYPAAACGGEVRWQDVPVPAARPTAALAGLGCLAASLVGCSSTPSAAPAARAYLSAWAAGDDARASAATDDEQAARRVLTAVRGDLDVAGMRVSLGKVTAKGADATARFRATLTLRGLGDWVYDGQLQLRRATNGTNGGWRVHWDPSDVHPRLTAGTTLRRTRSLPARAALLDGAGQPLFADTPVVTVGIEPARFDGKDPQATYTALVHAIPAVDPARVAREVKAAQPHAFVTVITLRRPDYLRVRAQIHDLPGTVFVEGTRALPPTTDFGRALLGRVGEVTAEILKQAPPSVVAGDQVGIGGLQEAYQDRLTGTASGKVQLVDKDGNVVATLAEITGHAGQPVRTTLDRRLQLAADAALAKLDKPAALVAIRPSDGAVLAVANSPGDSTYDRALDGRYPPGSTFKVITTYALLGRGMTESTALPCPPKVIVGGKEFRNFEGETSAGATFADDFAMSCNTAFVSAASRLRAADLSTAADAFGVGARWPLGLDAFTGSVPQPADAVEQAADAIGQGRVEVSPLGMALVAAAAQSGAFRAPTLVTDPAPSASPAQPQPLDSGRVATLRALMGLVVQRGTAASAGLPAGTAGKTGTAEFGTDNPPKTHAWFIGFRGDLAVAVLVEGGGVGGRVAAPIAAAFLRAAG
jgi:cell division protein FtsI/penicillin-binding protein 2